MKIIFFGTPNFAATNLKYLLGKGFEIVAIVTPPDSRKGRGKQLKLCAVKEVGLENNIPVLQPLKLRDEEFISKLKNYNADLFVVVAFRMLPEAVWNMPPLGTFNLHGSLLPAYRGAAPINWAIINGESKTGVTTFFLDKNIDTGSIIYQSELGIQKNWTAGDLHDAMMPIGATLVVKTVHAIISGHFTLQPQKSNLATHAPKLNKINCLLDFSKSPVELVNQIKGLSPFPGAYFGEYKFLNASTTTIELSCSSPLLYRLKGSLFLKYANGTIEITAIKPNGKRQMSGKDFVNGMQTEELQLFP